ncbi:hypothetical protein GOP47_0016824 [Adiantum capillus-veneris]|uniref:Metallo-beta-lactamase domain-containing protein n=1 Tax=Adiantum capillus-veneris TaxID=13818 RepID=A0A9D4UIF1_ADICA|nr:hypothetical protein GOP47_0016824 [Adiantum capillus-veneris]
MLLRSIASSFSYLPSSSRLGRWQPLFAVDNRTSASATLLSRIQEFSAPNSVPAFADGILGKQDAAELDRGKSYLLFLGTGTSEGIPRVSCLTNLETKCPVCWSAVEIGSKNRRRNTSILIRMSTASGMRNILIDAGKFFYHSALQWFPCFGVRDLDAVILTHSHADAIGGLDDLRDWTNNVQDVVPVYVAKRDFEVMRKTHYYLVDTSVVVEGAAVSELQFHIITEQSFFVHGLKVIPLPVWHGPGYRSLGYRFGNICYISDVSEIPEETYPLLKNCELLILDALRPDRSSATHFGLPQALEEVRKIRPKKTLFTGMMHTMDHEVMNTELAKLLTSEGLDIQLSYDGLQIPIDLQTDHFNDNNPPPSFFNVSKRQLFGRKPEAHGVITSEVTEQRL